MRIVNREEIITAVTKVGAVLNDCGGMIVGFFSVKFSQAEKERLN